MNNLRPRTKKWGEKLKLWTGKFSKEELQALRELKAHLKATEGVTASQSTIMIEATKDKYKWFRNRVKQLEKETSDQQPTL
jgi:site-specific DNA-adenine methylase